MVNQVEGINIRFVADTTQLEKATKLVRSAELEIQRRPPSSRLWPNGTPQEPRICMGCFMGRRHLTVTCHCGILKK